ncbi:hypothetical protein FQA39_LY16157 [Lamprigera yunnana]|nr:hypothetical protein FQA39_LY16157 [Lamprigera yunnana]
MLSGVIFLISLTIFITGVPSLLIYETINGTSRPVRASTRVDNGDNLVISCVDPKGANDLLWSKQNRIYRSPLGDTSTLMFNPVKTEHQGIYACSSVKTNLSRAIWIIVHDASVHRTKRSSVSLMSNQYNISDINFSDNFVQHKQGTLPYWLDYLRKNNTNRNDSKNSWNYSSNWHNLDALFDNINGINLNGNSFQYEKPSWLKKETNWDYFKNMSNRISDNISESLFQHKEPTLLPPWMNIQRKWNWNNSNENFLNYSPISYTLNFTSDVSGINSSNNLSQHKKQTLLPSYFEPDKKMNTNFNRNDSRNWSNLHTFNVGSSKSNLLFDDLHKKPKDKVIEYPESPISNNQYAIIYCVVIIGGLLLLGGIMCMCVRNNPNANKRVNLSPACTHVMCVRHWDTNPQAGCILSTLNATNRIPTPMVHTNADGDITVLTFPNDTTDSINSEDRLDTPPLYSSTGDEAKDDLPPTYDEVLQNMLPPSYSNYESSILANAVISHSDA